MTVWDDLLAEFRALGGAAENVRLGHGALGRGLFAVDPRLPVRIHAPESLLPDTEDIVFRNGALKVASASPLGARERRFVEDYYAHLAWGGGGRAEIEETVLSAQALPRELRDALTKEYRCGSCFEDYSPALVERQFLVSRKIAYRGRTVLMPIVDLANHGGAVNYDTTGGGVALEGVVTDEVLVKYSDMDSYGVFLSWGFACAQPQAMSISLDGNVGAMRLSIDRAFGDFKSAQGVWIPERMTVQGGAALSYLMLGNRQYPRLSRGIFYKLMREAGLSGFEEAFDTIQHVNRLHFLNLLAALEDVEGAMAATLGRMARFQLEALSFAVGVRPV